MLIVVAELDGAADARALRKDLLVCCDDNPCVMKAAVPRKSLCDPSLTQLAVPCLIAVASASPSLSHFGNSTAHLADGGRFCSRSRRVVCASSGGGGCIGLLFRTVTLASWRLKIVVTLTDCGLICVSGVVRVDRMHLACGPVACARVQQRKWVDSHCSTASVASSRHHVHSVQSGVVFNHLPRGFLNRLDIDSGCRNNLRGVSFHTTTSCGLGLSANYCI